VRTTDSPKARDPRNFVETVASRGPGGSSFVETVPGSAVDTVPVLEGETRVSGCGLDAMIVM
jgi:hypothetical protein